TPHQIANLLGKSPLLVSATPPGFTRLFNGKDLTGWHCPGSKISSWGTEDGILFIKEQAEKTNRTGDWLLTKKEYKDFELRLEWKASKGGNSGVALRTPPKGDPPYVGMEIQILDDPSYKGLPKEEKTGSIWDVVPASKSVAKPIGQWNSYKIICKGRKVSVELNGKKVVDADLDDYKEHAKKHPGILRTKGH